MKLNGKSRIEVALRAERKYEMRRFMIAVVAVVVVFAAGVSFAQESGPPTMPEKVRNTLDKVIGTWSVSEGGSGLVVKVVFRWDPGKHYVIMDGEFETEAGSLTSSALMSWDGVSEDEIVLFLIGPSGHSIEHIRIVSETVGEGESTGSTFGKKDSSKIRNVFQGPDKFTNFTTNEIVGGERQPDSTTVFTRVKTTSDEQELIRLENEIVDAILKRDVASLDRLWADDVTLEPLDGTMTISKDQALGAIESGVYVATSMTIDNLRVRVYGSTAVVSGLSTEKSQFMGGDASGQKLFTDTWIKRDGRWQCVHSSEVAETTNANENAVTAQPSPEMKKLEALDTKPGIQVNAAKEVTLGTGDSAKKATVHYLISLPENYNEQDKCPLLIFLHGAGERGNDLNRVKVHGPPKIVKEKNTTPFVIVSPQCPKREGWKAEKLSKLLDHILATTKADPERVYLTGLSLGGFGTWGWAAQEPRRFAAAIPICGRGSSNTAEKLVNLPIWAFHGGKDTVVPPSGSRAMVEAIKKAGGTKVKLTIYPEAGHDSWTKTYNNPEIYKWLLTHKRAK